MRREIILVILGLAALCGLQACAPSKKELNRQLLDACCTGDVQTASRVLDQGADPNTIDPSPDRPFSPLVVSLNAPELVQLLLEKGADPNKPDGSGLRPLYYAPSTSTLRVVERLVGAGADIKAKSGNGDEFIHQAASSGKIEMVQFALDHGASINEQDDLGFTPLHQAIVAPFASKETLGMVKWLIAHGADVSLKDKKGRTAYDWASQKFFARRPDGVEIQAALKPGKGKA